MSDWREVRIFELSTIDIGGTPSRANPVFWAEKPAGHPWISIADLKGKYVSETKEHITALGVRSSNVKLIPKHTTVMSFKLTVGRTAITDKEMFCNEAIAIFRPKDHRLNGQWLYHALPRIATSVVTDTAVKGATLNKAKMAEMTVNLPPPGEQAKIAQVLDTLDTAIQQTEAIIAKLKAVKQGLLNDLLTRGIDANGELRPPQAEAPHLYKESSLGWIPKEWDFDAIENFLDRIIDYRGKTPEKTESGVPLITAKNVRLGYIDPEPREFIAVENFERWMSRGIPRKGDVLFTTEAPLGNVAQIETHDRLAFAQRMIVLQSSSRLVSSFLKYLLLGKTFRARLFALGSGSTVEGIQQSTFRKLLVAIPGSIVEQNSIVEMLTNLDSKIDYESNCLGKLKQTKAGLMDDFLSGRVRVTPLLTETPYTQKVDKEESHGLGTG